MANPNCSPSCSYTLVESLPFQADEISLLPGTNYTYNSWLHMITSAKSTIKIAAFYFTLQNKAVEEAGGYQGNNIFNALKEAASRGVKVTIVQSDPINSPSEDNMKELEAAGVEVVDIKWSQAFQSGILHTKMIIVDNEHFYIGSANMDWRSLTQVKELGIVVSNCNCMASDATKIFNVYYLLATSLENSLDSFVGWPQSDETRISQFSPLSLIYNGKEKGEAFISSAPATVNPPARTNDIQALLNVINNATSTVSGSVMDYMPMRLYSKPVEYWGELDTAFRNAMFRGVHVRLLISYWNRTDIGQFITLNSLYSFKNFCTLTSKGRRNVCNGTLDIKIFRIPDPVGYEPYNFTRVNHAKYVVTDKAAYISTSNWSWDYFYTTAGVSYVGTHPEMVMTTQSIFDRDWNSSYAQDLSIYLKQFHLTH